MAETDEETFREEDARLRADLAREMRMAMALAAGDRATGWWLAAQTAIELVRDDIAAEFDRLSGNHNPDDPEGSRRWSDFYAHAAERIRHPDRFSGVASGVTADV